MYIPKPFEVNDIESQLDVVKNWPLAMLISTSKKSIFSSTETNITHLPLLVREDKTSGDKKLVGHLAKDNDHWRAIQSNPECLVVFRASDSYISPAWYPTKLKNPKVVPTWCFAAVHVHGEAKIIEDKVELLNILNELTDFEENKRPCEKEGIKPQWHVSEAPTDYVDKLMEKIVGIEIEIKTTEGKFKFDQVRPPLDARGLIDNFKKEVSGEKGNSMAYFVEKYYPREIPRG